MYKLSKDTKYVDTKNYRRGRSSAVPQLNTERPRNARYLRSLVYEGPKSAATGGKKLRESFYLQG